MAGIDITKAFVDVTRPANVSFMLQTRETPHPGNGLGFGIYYMFFELHAIYERTDGSSSMGPGVPFRVGAYLWGDPQQNAPIADFDIRAGDEARGWYAIRGHEIPGDADLLNRSLVWRLDRTNLSELGNGSLPLDRAWRISHVYAEARATSEWFSEAVFATGMRPAYHRFDDARKDRGPDFGFGNEERVSALLAEAPMDPPLAAAASWNAAIPNGPFLWWSVVSLLLFPVFWVTRKGLWGWFVGFPFFTRILRHEALNNARRALILEVVRHQAGIGFAGLRRATELGSGALAHHVHVLVQQGLIEARMAGKRRAYYLPGQGRDDSRMVWDDLLDYVRRFPQSDAASIARALGRPRTSVAYQLRRLELARRVVSRRAGRARKYCPA